MGKKIKNRQRRGMGGIRQHKNGYKEGSYNIYRKDGTRIRKSFTRATVDEINDIKAQLRLLKLVDNDVEDVHIDLHTNEITLIYKNTVKNKMEDNKDLTVNEYMNTFLFEHRIYGVKGKKVQDTTFSGYVDKCKLIEKYLGDKKIKDLTLKDLKQFIQKLQDDKYKVSTVKQTRDMITSFMKFAKKDGVIKNNVLADEKLTITESKEKAEKYIITKADYEKFINYCKEHNYFDLIFLLFTGLRVSELAGITWKDIDLEKGIVNIHKEYTRIVKIELVNGKRKRTTTKGFKELKSKTSYRIIGIEALIKELKKHKELQIELANKNYKKFSEEDFVFTNSYYRPLTTDNVWDRVKKAMCELKITNYDKISTHNIRHSFCTNGLSSGVKIEDMKVLMRT